MVHDAVSRTLVLASCLGVRTVRTCAPLVVYQVLVVATVHPPSDDKVWELFLVIDDGTLLDGQRRSKLNRHAPVHAEEHVLVELHGNFLFRDNVVAVQERVVDSGRSPLQHGNCAVGMVHILDTEHSARVDFVRERLDVCEPDGVDIADPVRHRVCFLSHDDHVAPAG